MIIDIECPDCEDGRQWKSRYGGNDPDVWPVTCERCGGSGVIEHDLNDDAEDD